MFVIIYHNSNNVDLSWVLTRDLHKLDKIDHISIRDFTS